MNTLKSLKCPICGKEIVPKDGFSSRAYSYSDCLRRCETCNIGFSNAKSNPTKIYKYYNENVPELLRHDLQKVLGKSINELNRLNKFNKLAFSTSEDALTWSFFKYFDTNKRQSDLLKLLDIDSRESSCDIYLWGTNISSQNEDKHDDFYKQFIKVSDLFKEKSIKRTEPDVVIKLNDELIFIEVKYRSKNDVKSYSDKFQKYLLPGIDSEKLIQSGLYELYRNWAFALKLSNGGKFKVINLGMKSLFNDSNLKKLNLFESSLGTGNGKFVMLSWECILDKMIANGSYDEWFIDYLKKKILPQTEVSKI